MDAMTIGADPDQLSAAERIEEIASLLGEGLMRLRAAKSTRISDDHGESSLHLSADQSGPDDPGSLEVEG
jgi:hypothetical protein